MSVRCRPKLEDHLWYPILVTMPDTPGVVAIKEMLGKDVNEWNTLYEYIPKRMPGTI